VNINDDFIEICKYAHMWNWVPDWDVVQQIYKTYPDSYSVLTPFAYTYLEELIRSTTSEYGMELLDENGCVIFSIKKHRIAHLNSTACYLKKDNIVLMIKFTKKWGHVYAPPGGKFEEGETPLDCIMREFYEETGLTLVNPNIS